MLTVYEFISLEQFSFLGNKNLGQNLVFSECNLWQTACAFLIKYLSPPSSSPQVNMPADSFESPLTLAACGGHTDLALLLLERGANIEEVNDEGYTPLMEAAREGHEEMVTLLLARGEYMEVYLI